MLILAPDRMAEVFAMAIERLPEGVVGTDNDEKQPGEDGEDLVREEVTAGEFFAFCEGVVCQTH